MKDIHDIRWPLLVIAIGVGFAGSMDYREDVRLERAKHDALKQRTATYAEAIAACLNETGFVLKDAIVMCQTIEVPGKPKAKVQL